MKKICFVSSCYNEELNIEELYNRIQKQTQNFKQYQFEYILLDNSSTDNTAQKLRALAKRDKHVKVILNARNFGHIRSPYYGLLNVQADAAIYLASDLQDPPELIPALIKKWEEGYKIVLAQKNQSEEFFLFFLIRKLFYNLINSIDDSGAKLIKNCTGFGLYDRRVIDVLRSLDDPYPYLRGIICEIGFKKAIIPFVQPTRKRGFSKNNFYTLYDIAMLGIVKHSKVPLRVMIFFGLVMAFLSFLTSCFYLFYKLIYWDSFSLGMAPIIIGFFFLFSVQFIFLGLLGEYIGAIWTRVDKKPLVVEDERLNF